MKLEFFPEEQLDIMVRKWKPNSKIDIVGIVLDYCQRSNTDLYTVLDINDAIYDELFFRVDQITVECLLSNLLLTPESAQNLYDKCKAKFPEVNKILIKNPLLVRMLRRKDMSNFNSYAEDTYECLRDNHVIWQLSDIHFGKLNIWENDPVELASALFHAIGMAKETTPEYIIISGDITSISAVEEYDQFRKFCDQLSKNIWKSQSPQRILLVPGNHEVTWSANGNADKLSRFRERFSDDSCCITPFGKEQSHFLNPTVKVERYGLNEESCPPLALVRLEEIGVDILLLISSYHSGEILKGMWTLIENEIGEAQLKEKLYEHLRQDPGHINLQYLSLIANAVESCNNLGIAVMHHHPQPYGSELSFNKHGFALLKTLWQRNFRLLLHGHLHMFEDEFEGKREAVTGLTFCIPCSTLSSHSFRRSPGFLIHAIDKESKKYISTFTWEISSSNIFSTENIRQAYFSNFDGK